MLIDFTSVRNFVETESFEFDPVVLVDLTSLVTVTLTFLVSLREAPAV
jgi:hypothetical protein